MPLDRSTVVAIVERELPGALAAMGLGHWRVNVRYGPIDFPGAGTTVALCTLNPPYERATIDIDPEAVEDEPEVAEALRHELIHVVLAPLELLREVACEHAAEGPAREALDLVTRHAIEQTVRNVERLLDAGRVR